MKAAKSTGKTVVYRGVSIRERFNASGSVSYRAELPTKIKGKRAFVQFKTKTAARQKIDDMLAQHANEGTAGFKLTGAQRDEAAKALALLAPTGRSLTHAAEFFVRHFKPPQGDVTTAELTDVLVKNSVHVDFQWLGNPCRCAAFR